MELEDRGLLARRERKRLEADLVLRAVEHLEVREHVGQLGGQVRGAHAYEGGEEQRGEAAADETLPGLLGRELDEPSAAEEEAEDVGEDVVRDDAHRRHDEPEEPVVDVVHDRGGLRHDQQQRQDRPPKLPELVLVHAALERENEEQQSADPEHEADELVVLVEHEEGRALQDVEQLLREVQVRGEEHRVDEEQRHAKEVPAGVRGGTRALTSSPGRGAES